MMMQHPATSVSVVICAYTEARWNSLLEAVETVRAQALSPHEIIVVIDHNPTLYTRARKALPDCIVVQNSAAPGLSGARNTGIAATDGDIIAFMDEDASAAPDWLTQLVGSYRNAHVIGVGGAIEPNWLTGRPRWFPPEFDWVVGCTYRGMPTKMATVRNLIGCNMSFRRTIFGEIGGFRSTIGRIGAHPFGCEETELCIRAKQRCPDYVFMYAPHARVYHQVPPQRATWRYFRARCYAEGISKALVTQYVGQRDGLAAERQHALRTLPRAVCAALLDAMVHRDPAGVYRAVAIITGLTLTTLGYLQGTTRASALTVMERAANV